MGITIAYATLSATLNISFANVSQNKLSWNVGFEGTSAAGTASGTSAVGRSCGDASITPTSVSVSETTLSKPGDKCVYTLNIKNSGTIDANLSTITPVKPSGITCESATGGTLICGNITYKLATDVNGTTVLANNTSLRMGTTSTVYLVVAYTGTELNTVNIAQTGAAFTLNYAQA